MTRTKSRVVPLVLRSHATRLLASEQAYLHNLRVLVASYVKPMRQRANELGVLPGTLAELFSNTEQLLSTHARLERYVRRATTARELAAHFVRVSTAFEAYAVYVSNFATAIQTLHACAPRVQAALAECEADVPHELPLTMLMSAPLNRIADYVVAFDKLVELAQKNCRASAAAAVAVNAASAAAASGGGGGAVAAAAAGEDDEGGLAALTALTAGSKWGESEERGSSDDEDDSDDGDELDSAIDSDDSLSSADADVDIGTLRALLSAMAVLKQTHEYVQQKVDGAQHQTEVRAVRLRVPGKETLHLVTPKRKLLDEGDVVVFEEGKGRLRHFFIFNDMLLLAKSDEKRKTSTASSSSSLSPLALSFSGSSTSNSDRAPSSHSDRSPVSNANALGDMLDRPSLVSPRGSLSPRPVQQQQQQPSSPGSLSPRGSHHDALLLDSPSPAASPRAKVWGWRGRASSSSALVQKKTRASTLSASDVQPGSKHGPPLRHKLTVPLSDRRFTLRPHTGAAPKSAPQAQWALCNDSLSGTVEPLVFFTADGDESDGGGRLARAIGGILSDQFTVFGAPLQLVMDEERKLGSTRDVPFAVDVLASLLRQRFLKTEGLFRVSGSMQVAVDLQNRITESVLNGSFDARFDEIEAADLATTLKKFVRMLPEPLFPHDRYEAVLKLGSAGVVARKVGLRREVARLPKVNLDLVRYLVMFLGDVAAHAAENMMTVENIAIVFGPSFLQPQLESFDYAFQVPLVNAIVADLIRYRDAILVGDAAALSLKSPSLGQHRFSAVVANATAEPPVLSAADAALLAKAEKKAAADAASGKKPTKPVVPSIKDKRLSRPSYETGIKKGKKKQDDDDDDDDDDDSTDAAPETGLVRGALKSTALPTAAVLSPRERAFLYGRPVGDEQFESSEEEQDDGHADAESASDASAITSASSEDIEAALARHRFSEVGADFADVFKAEGGGFDSLASSAGEQPPAIMEEAPAPPAPAPLKLDIGEMRLISPRRRRDSSASPTFLSPRSGNASPRTSSPRVSERRRALAKAASPAASPTIAQASTPGRRRKKKGEE